MCLYIYIETESVVKKNYEMFVLLKQKRRTDAIKKGDTILIEKKEIFNSYDFIFVLMIHWQSVAVVVLVYAAPLNSSLEYANDRTGCDPM